MNLFTFLYVYIYVIGYNSCIGGDFLEDFEQLLKAERKSVERYVKFRISSRDDADDVIQEIFLSAYSKFPTLKNKDCFKAWIISISKNKCNDYFRKKAGQCDISIDDVSDKMMYDSRHPSYLVDAVRETLSMLENKDRQILYLYYWQDIPQADIAGQLNIPLGTVKSRLHTAKQNFRNIYPNYSDVLKGDNNMKIIPDMIPEYKIEASTEPPFNVKWEELMGWFLVPRLGEKISWGMYEIPSRKCIRIFDMNVTGKAKVHGIEGVEFDVKETSCLDKNDVVRRSFVAQLTDTHCRYLASLRYDGDVRNYITSLDGDSFLDNWGFG